MDFKLSGSVADVNAVHVSKARRPMSVTLSGMIISVNAVHPLKAALAMEVVPAVIVIDVAPPWHLSLRDTRVALSWNLGA